MTTPTIATMIQQNEKDIQSVILQRDKAERQHAQMCARASRPDPQRSKAEVEVAMTAVKDARSALVALKQHGQKLLDDLEHQRAHAEQDRRLAITKYRATYLPLAKQALRDAITTYRAIEGLNGAMLMHLPEPDGDEITQYRETIMEQINVTTTE